MIKSKAEKQQELMDYIQGYTPSERLPFACRLCKFQGSCEEDLRCHRASDAHKQAAELEKKACFCRLCRKQFTSAAQLSEHLKGKDHHETLQRRMGKGKGKGEAGKGMMGKGKGKGEVGKGFGKGFGKGKGRGGGGKGTGKGIGGGGRGRGGGRGWG